MLLYIGSSEYETSVESTLIYSYTVWFPTLPLPQTISVISVESTLIVHTGVSEWDQCWGEVESCKVEFVAVITSSS